MDHQRRLASELLARGDREAFGRLAELLGAALHRFCLAQLPPSRRDAAEDCRQECLLRAYRSRKRFRPEGDATAWMLGIAMNVVREWRRKDRGAWPLGDLDPAAPLTKPDERRPRLASAVESLPDRQREAVVCRFLRGMSVAETANVMGCAEGTVKASVFKAIANLQRRLKRESP